MPAGMALEHVDKKLATAVKIGTHDGTFHCDEALACFMLMQLPEYRYAEVVRTRDLKILDACDVVVDVGAVYDPVRFRFDHHQRGFAETMSSLDPRLPWTIKLSSAGLIYFHFGHRVIAEILKLEPKDPKIEIFFERIYENLLKEIDAIDNGIPICDGTPSYKIMTGISSRVGDLNPAWNDTDAAKNETSSFDKAVKLVGSELVSKLKFLNDAWWPAKVIVETAIDDRHEVDPSGQIIVFKSGGCPWKEHLLRLETSLGVSPQILFVLFPDANGSWRVQGVPMEHGSFICRKFLPENWRGIRDDVLSEVTGILGCIFVHATGFIGGNKTYDGALEMARAALK